MNVFLENPEKYQKSRYGAIWFLANRNFKGQENHRPIDILGAQGNQLVISDKNLGFSAFINEQNKINEIVETIINRFDLIMISDYMDESEGSTDHNC